MSARRHQVLLSTVAIVGIVGTSLGLAAAGGQLRPFATTAKLKVTPATPPAITRLAPGDVAQRLLTVTNTGAKPMKLLHFMSDERRSGILGKVVPAPRGATTPPGYRWERRCWYEYVPGSHLRIVRCRTNRRPIPTLLAQSANNIKMRVELCSVPWRRLSSKAPSYRCPGKQTTVMSARRVIQPQMYWHVPLRKPGQSYSFRVTYTFPRGAGNVYQGRSSHVIPGFTLEALW